MFYLRAVNATSIFTSVFGRIAQLDSTHGNISTVFMLFGAFSETKKNKKKNKKNKF